MRVTWFCIDVYRVEKTVDIEKNKIKENILN